MFRRLLVKQLLALSAVLMLSPAWADATPQAPVAVRLTTNMGVIELALDRNKAPISVENFLTYMDSGHYNQTLFHRVIDDFMIQGGGFTTDMRQRATLPPIANEAENGLKNVRGSIAMARRNDPASATSQFFINLSDNHFLDNGSRGFGYAVFGKVTKGMDVVDAIGKVKTLRGDKPAEPMILISVEKIQ
ncbi:peptidylprolyl isomerase [Oceanobacter sp. 4_MG-2023]|nr:peptidylprolyl isomerase [Oceanobacter sp. 4_MG-2023]MDP2548130.1 peptidylprolyl isomerase [Oceanobacter sp. 4_MG-2023]